jgi:GNAT superfamily N-acetyltransferase
MTQDKIQLRIIEGSRLGHDETEQLVELLERAFNGWPGSDFHATPIEHLEWKLRDFPPGAHVIVGEAGSKIVAAMTVMRRQWIVGGVSRLVRDGVDLAIAPSFQGQGLYTAMRRYAAEHDDPQFDLEFLYRTAPATIRVKQQLGVRLPANAIQVLLKPYSAQRLVAEGTERGAGRVRASFLALGLIALQTLNRLHHPPYPRETPTWSVSTIDKFDDRMEAFLRETLRSFDFVQERSTEYLNWRYCDPRGGRFTVRVAEQNNRVLGYIVWKKSGAYGHIVDFLALPGRADVARSLLEDALRILEKTGIKCARCWMVAYHPYFELLRRCGFIVSKKKPDAGYRPLRLDESELQFLAQRNAKIHVMLGDSDYV